MRKLKFVASIIATGMTIATLSSLLTTTIAVDSKEILLKPENKISDELTKLMSDSSSSSSEEYPVILWYDNVDNEEVELCIEEEIGFNLATLEEEYSKPSDELITELYKAAGGNSNKYLDLLMKNHLKLTEKARSEEKEKTELYRKTRRELIKEMNLEEINSIIETNNIPDEKIRFKSSFAPIIVCDLSTDEIEKCSKKEEINEITTYESFEIIECVGDFGTTKSTMDIDRINDCINLTGDGIKIGIYETYTVSEQYIAENGLSDSQVTIIGPEYNIPDDNGDYKSHSTHCAGIAAGSSGVAPGAEIYSSTSNFDWESYVANNYECSQLPNLERLIDYGVDFISMSWGFDSNKSCYSSWAKYMDYLIENTCTTMLCATGNVASAYNLGASCAYNCIAVNGFIDEKGGISQNLLNNYSYKHGNGCLKPDVVAPSLDNGTSTATPYLAGMIALMYQYKPSLIASPETTKAIVMASCHKKCSKLISDKNDNPRIISNLSETMQDGLTDRQGAGIPNMYTMISIVSQHTYGNGVLNSSNDFERNVYFVQPTYDSNNINITMAYMQKNVPTSGSSGMLDNLEMQIINNNVTSTSNNSNSSTEMIYQSLSTSPSYRMRIYKNSGESAEIRYGYAWSTDNEKFYNNYGDEGVYKLKNYASQRYLVKNSYDKAWQTSHGNSSALFWILDCVSINNETYNMKNANITSNGLGLGTLISTTNYYALEGSSATTNPINITFDNETGTYTFTQSINGTVYALGINGNSTSTGAYANWTPYSSLNSSQKWYLETVNYRAGDVNYDGSISDNDYSLIVDYVSQNVSFNNLQKYLGDANRDNYVNVADAVYIGELADEST